MLFTLLLLLLLLLLTANHRYHCCYYSFDDDHDYDCCSCAAFALLSLSPNCNVPVSADWQIPLGRRFRSLKLWMVLRTYGVEKLQGSTVNAVLTSCAAVESLVLGGYVHCSVHPASRCFGQVF